MNIVRLVKLIVDNSLDNIIVINNAMFKLITNSLYVLNNAIDK